MKTSKKILLLLDEGFSLKTLSRFSESQINVLYRKMLKEAQVTTTQSIDLTADEVKGGYKVPDSLMAGKKNVEVTPNPKSPGGVRLVPTTENELEEDVEVTSDPNKEKETQDPKQVGPSSDDGFGDETDGMGMFESKKKENNPWRICTAQLGKEFGTRERHLWSAKEKNKYKRCVEDVKNSLKENKQYVSLFLENEIMKIVERNLPPRITKGDLIKYLSEAGPAVAPSKPAPSTKPAKPTTKPSKPVKPSHPGKNPLPGVKPAPKAISPEVAKDEVINLIINLLEK